MNDDLVDRLVRYGEVLDQHSGVSSSDLGAQTRHDAAQLTHRRYWWVTTAAAIVVLGAVAGVATWLGRGDPSPTTASGTEAPTGTWASQDLPDDLSGRVLWRGALLVVSPLWPSPFVCVDEVPAFVTSNCDLLLPTWPVDLPAGLDLEFEPDELFQDGRHALVDVAATMVGEVDLTDLEVIGPAAEGLRPEYTCDEWRRVEPEATSTDVGSGTDSLRAEYVVGVVDGRRYTLWNLDRLSLAAICVQLGHPEDATFTSLLEPVPTGEG